jgi:excisionase family DNA binding protein
MGSNIKVQRICEQCGIQFAAKTTTTKYCSHRCNKAAYKSRQKAIKVEQSEKESQIVKSQPIEELKAKEFLSVTQVSKLIGCSRQNVYNLINSGKLKATNILLKKTIVKRSDLDELFIESTSQIQIEGISNTQTQDFVEVLKFEDVEISECYNITEVQSKYGISATALQNLVKRFEIPKVKQGWFVYVPKVAIDNLLG